MVPPGGCLIVEIKTNFENPFERRNLSTFRVLQEHLEITQKVQPSQMVLTTNQFNYLSR
jgi:hypothetical protein